MLMNRIDKTDNYRDYKTRVAVIIDDSIEIHIGKEDILRLYNPIALEFGSVVVAFCDSWEFV